MPLAAGLIALLILVAAVSGVTLATRDRSPATENRGNDVSAGEAPAVDDSADIDSAEDGAAEQTTVTTTETADSSVTDDPDTEDLVAGDPGTGGPGTEEPETENPVPDQETGSENDPIEETEEPTPSGEGSEPVYYSTNGKDTVKNGNSGVYAYRRESRTHENYCIIDFDEGYVYFFSYMGGTTDADRLKIEYGTLNDVVVVTYHYDNGSTWPYGLYFKYMNVSSHLVIQDIDGHHDYLDATDLEEALKILETREIYDY